MIKKETKKKGTFELQEEMFKKRKEDYEERGGRTFEEIVESANEAISNSS